MPSTKKILHITFMNKTRLKAIFERFKCAVKIIIYGHLFNWGNREKRRKIRQDVTARFIPEYFKMYLPADGFEEQAITYNDDNDNIFSVWLQGEENAPKLIKACFDSIRKNCKQQLIVIDEKTLDQYIQLPDYIMNKRKKRQIGNAHFADIIRVELLHKYGGYWLDATCYVTESIPNWIEKEDFFIFLTGTEAGFPYYFVQNCFIRSRKGAYLLEAWRYMIHRFWKYERSNYDYFMHQFLFKTLVTKHSKAIDKFNRMTHKDQEATHALWYKYRNLPYDDDIFRKVTKDAFFQKTTYRGGDFVEGSFGDIMTRQYDTNSVS